MLSAALAIANAVQFSVCSGVLRVLGLARAGPSDIVGFLLLPENPLARTGSCRSQHTQHSTTRTELYGIRKRKRSR